MSDINFENYEVIDSDAWELKRDMINKYQELSGRTLTEASPETLIFSTVAYLMALREEKHNDDIKQNYLRYARDKRLDLKGEFYGSRGRRLLEQPAIATFRFYISAIQATDVVIPKGSRIQYNELYFETNEEYKILKGNLTTDGTATCTTVGKVGNNIPVGQIINMVDIYPYYNKVENITVSNNGSDLEPDENYRKRIREIPESFTTAGSKGAYEFWSKTASSNIIDVKVHSPSATNVDVYIWTENGVVSQELKNRVSEVLNEENIRPLTDNLSVKEPLKINYNINFDYYINKENETLVNIIKENVTKTVGEYVKWQKGKIGRDINPDELIKRLKIAGVKRISLRNPVFTKLNFNQIAINSSIVSNYQGVEEQ